MSKHKNYMERMREKARASRERVQSAREGRSIYAERIIEGYEEAYRAVHGVDGAALRLRYSEGWVRGTGFFKPVRLGELEHMTRSLWARVHEAEIDYNNGE